MIKIGLLIYQECLPAGLMTGLDFFKVADLLSSRNLFEVKTVGLERGAVVCAHNQVIEPEELVQKFQPDIIVIPGFWSQLPDDLEKTLSLNLKLQKYLNSLSKKTSVWSYCTGVLFHAKTGRLNNQNATATWWLSQYVQRNFPKVEWQINQVVSESRRDLTASGANGFYALYESGLRMMKEEKLLQEVQKYLMLPTTLKSADPFYELELLLSSNMELFKIKKIVEKLGASELNSEVVAKKLNITTKTLARQLAKQSKWTPALLYRSIKYKEAAELLILTELSVPEICHKLGFADEPNFRRGFKRATGMTPGEYQQKFKTNS